ncbi:UDP-glucuronic acid decarboxylase 1 [Perkinsus chesapeaki]|uniref:UDP-glucuronic acid decarboxylase 1 n=1 Tax=Perkinsus chesapeaki TaxID=330153 RepID=A0A7J6LPA0_PERCH|nr:UDP-glucuronic acid decarboxylase 1 [Perkinsus chesapeaki]
MAFVYCKKPVIHERCKVLLFEGRTGTNEATRFHPDVAGVVRSRCRCASWRLFRGDDSLETALLLLRERLQLVRDQVEQSTKHLGKTTKKADVIRQRSLRLLATVQYWQSDYLQSVDFTDTPDQRVQLEETSLKVWRMICEMESAQNLADVEDKILAALTQVADFYQGLCDLVGIQVDVEKAEEAEEVSSDTLKSIVAVHSIAGRRFSPTEIITKPPRDLPALPKKRILVTGGGGFIGSHMVDFLMQLGHEVICMDNFFCGDKVTLRFYRSNAGLDAGNVAHWLSNPRFELIRHDVTQEVLLEVDQIYHLACPASPVHYQHNAIKTLKTNVIGTLNMCGIAKRTGARLLLASTSEVYGDPEQHPQTEAYFGNVNCIGTRSCYDEGKRAAEALCMDYHRQHGVDVRIARIFNTYGPRMMFHDGRVVSNFLVQALRGDKITVYGDGNQTRSFCFVSDLVLGLYRLMNCESTIGPVNLGNPSEFRVGKLANMVRELAAAGEGSSELDIEYRTLPQDDPRRFTKSDCGLNETVNVRRQPDISLARNHLDGWQPKIPLKEGLRITYDDFKRRAEADESLQIMKRRESPEYRRGAVAKYNRSSVGADPVDDITTFRGRLARDSRARAVEQALRTTSPQVSMRIILSSISLEKYYPHFRDSGFDLIEANQRQTGREVEDIIETVSRQQRVHIPHEDRAKIWKALRCISLRYDPRRMIPEDPREEVIMLWIRNAKAEIAGKMSSIRQRIRRQQKIVSLLRGLRFINLCLFLLSLLTSFIEARKLDGRLFFKALVSSNNFMAATSYWIAFLLIFAIGRSGDTEKHDHGLKKYQRLYGLAKRLDGEITSFRFDTEAKRNAKFDLMGEDVEKYFGLRSSTLGKSILDEGKRQTFDGWFAEVMSKPYDKEDLRQQIEMTKTEHLPLEDVPGMAALYKDAQHGRRPELLRSEAVKEREIFSVDEYQRSAVPNIALKYQNEMYDPQREQDQLLAYEHERRAVERMMQLEDKDSDFSEFSSSAYESESYSGSSYYSSDSDEGDERSSDSISGSEEEWTESDHDSSYSGTEESDEANSGTSATITAGRIMVNMCEWQSIWSSKQKGAKDWRLQVLPDLYTTGSGAGSSYVADLTPLTALICILLPIPANHKARQITKAFALDHCSHNSSDCKAMRTSNMARGGLTSTEFELFVHQSLLALSKLLSEDLVSCIHVVQYSHLSRLDYPDIEGSIPNIVDSISERIPRSDENVGSPAMLGTSAMRGCLRGLWGVCDKLISSVDCLALLCYRIEAHRYGMLQPSQFKEGLLFAGRYRILRRLQSGLASLLDEFNEGTLGFHVTDELRDTHVPGDSRPSELALWIRPVNSEEYINRRFKRESFLLKNVCESLSGRVMKVFDFGEATGCYLYRVTEVLEGITLKEYLDRRREYIGHEHTTPFEPSVLHRRPLPMPLTELEIISLLEAILSILVQLQIVGTSNRSKTVEPIVHSALDPSAIFLRGGQLEDVLIIGWQESIWNTERVAGRKWDTFDYLPASDSIGLCNARAAGVADACAMGCSRDARYTSPTLSEKDAKIPAAASTWDLYSLGCIAFECVCSLPPFLGMSHGTEALSASLADHFMTAKESSAGQPKERGPFPWSESLYLPSKVRDLYKETTESQAVDERVRRCIFAEHERFLPADLRPVCRVSDDLIHIIEAMLSFEIKDSNEVHVLDNESSKSGLTLIAVSEPPFAYIASRLQRLKEKLQTLPKRLKDAILPGQQLDESNHDGVPSTSLDLRGDALPPFTQRYLIKFATLISNATIRLSGGEVPLYHSLVGSTELSLGNRQLCSLDVEVLSRCLDACVTPTLADVDLSDNFIAFTTPSNGAGGPRQYDLIGLASFVKPLALLPLRSLNISGNSLGSHGGELLCNALAHCIDMEILRISNCDILPKGAIALASTLGSLPHLHTLDLPHNYVGDEGASAIAKTLSHVEPGGPCGSLVDIVMFSNSIGPSGGRSLAMAVESNFTILRLAIDRNSIPDAQGRAIEHAIGFNNRLKELFEDSLRFGQHARTLVAEMLQKWASQDPQVSKRLKHRLAKPRTKLEEEVVATLKGEDLRGDGPVR